LGRQETRWAICCSGQIALPFDRSRQVKIVASNKEQHMPEQIGSFVSQVITQLGLFISAPAPTPRELVPDLGQFADLFLHLQDEPIRVAV
jgi:hypothetical protein